MNMTANPSDKDRVQNGTPTHSMSGNATRKSHSFSFIVHGWPRRQATQAERVFVPIMRSGGVLRTIRRIARIGHACWTTGRQRGIHRSGIKREAIAPALGCSYR